MFEFGDEQIARLLAAIYRGSTTEYNLPVALYYAIADYLKKGLYEGFGGSLSSFTVGSTDFELLSELRENVYMFSGAKTYQQIKTMSELLAEGDSVLSFKDYRRNAREIFDLYNETWGLTEYNTTIGQAQCAVKWNDIQRYKDVLPLLKYSAVGHENTCPICGALDGLVRPVDDIIWRTKSPLNHFGCMCLLLQLSKNEELITGDEYTSKLDKEVGSKMQPLFKMNPGIDRVIFSDKHPYFEVAPKDRAYAKKNFDLPIPEKD